MRITIEFHGVLRQLAGDERCVVELPGGTVADALALLCRQQPQLAERLPRVACAIGSELVSRQHRLADDSTLALIPPVSGG
jgi:sulfur-carrier protein